MNAKDLFNHIKGEKREDGICFIKLRGRSGDQDFVSSRHALDRLIKAQCIESIFQAQYGTSGFHVLELSCRLLVDNLPQELDTDER